MRWLLYKPNTMKSLQTIWSALRRVYFSNLIAAFEVSPLTAPSEAKKGQRAHD